MDLDALPSPVARTLLRCADSESGVVTFTGLSARAARCVPWLRRAPVFVLAALAVATISLRAWDSDRIARAAEKYGPTAVANARALQQTMAELVGKDDDTQLRVVNDFYNQHLAFKEDIDNWGVIDYWASPLEGLGKGAGDCEDYAIGKYFTLVTLGMPHSKLRMVYVRASTSGARSVAHMVLAYYPKPDAEPLVLDNLQADIHPAAARRDLTPVFSFNAEGLWPGIGAARTPGDPLERLSKWREVVARSRQDGFR